MSQTVELEGNGVSPGIAIGKVFILDRSRIRISRQLISESSVEKEKKRFRSAVKKSQEQLQAILSKVNAFVHREHALIIQTHISILDDEMFTGATLQKIEKDKVNAEFALRSVLEETRRVFDEMDDPYLRERFSDVDYVGERTIRNLVGQAEERVSDIKDPSIIVAHDLSPADTAQMSRERILGFVTSSGGPTGHTAIVARSLEIPAVVGVEGLFENIHDSDEVIIDGTNGKVVVCPDVLTTEHFVRLRQEYEEIDRELHTEVHLPAITRDGYRIQVSANVEVIHELPLLARHGAEGIGLYRTEYLYLDRKDLPSEEEHYENYRKVVETVSPARTTIRTLDLGGDKFNHALPMPPELNPAMGLRAIRFCLRETDVFRSQLRGILRASAHGPVRIMFPMISGLQEIREAVGHLQAVREELRREGKRFDENIPVGSMMEVPSAAVIAERLAREVDFFSIGTNDLIQYTLAIDRVNENVTYLYNPLHPAVLSLVRQIAEAGRKAGIEVAMCGEMSGKPLYIPLLVGLGVTVLSMPAQAIPRAKRIVRAITMKDAKKIAEEVFDFGTADEISVYLRKVIKENWADAFPRDIFVEETGSLAAHKKN